MTDLSEEAEQEDTSVTSQDSVGDDFLERLRQQDDDEGVSGDEQTDDSEGVTYSPPPPLWSPPSTTYQDFFDGGRNGNPTANPTPTPTSNPPTVRMSVAPTLTVQELTGKPTLNQDSVNKFYTYIRSVVQAGQAVDRNSLIHDAAKAQIRFMLMSCSVPDFSNWMNWDNEKLFKTLLQVFPDRAKGLCIEDDFQKIKFDFALMKGAQSLLAYSEAVRELYDKLEEVSERREKAFVDILLKQISDEPAHYKHFKHRVLGKGKPVTVPAFLDRAGHVAQRLYETCTEAKLCGLVEPTRSGQHTSTKSHVQGYRGGDRMGGNSSTIPRSTDPKACTGCGRQHHTSVECRLKQHPDWNSTNSSWVDSVKGKAWLNKNAKVLPFRATLDGKPFDSRKIGEQHAMCASLTHSYIPTLSGLISTDNHTRKITFVLDTCAFQDNYISADVAEWLLVHGARKCSCGSVELCSPINNNCVKLNKKYSFKLAFNSETDSQVHQFDIQATVLDTSKMI